MLPIRHIVLLLIFNSITTDSPHCILNKNMHEYTSNASRIKYESTDQINTSNNHSGIYLRTTNGEQTSTLLIYIYNIKGRSGQVCIALFTCETTFRNEQAQYERHIQRRYGDSDTLIVEMQLPAGKYGVTVLDDIDGDGQMRYGIAGIPLEGFGFSNYQHKGLKRPRFSNFSFHHTPPLTSEIAIKMQYFR
jgi:uncharacterized protein (DUF2141 family)